MNLPWSTILKRKKLLVSALLAIAAIGMAAGCSSIETSLLFYPTHRSDSNGLVAWNENGALVGYARPVAAPRNVWLMLHGNGGQAADRVYAVDHFAADDAVYILEYPGYGKRDGVPSSASINEAAQSAYMSLRARYPGKPVCVVGESIGSGPASMLAGMPVPPDKIVLITPYDSLSLAAKEHAPSIAVSLLMHSDWDNVAALAHYRGAVDIYGAQNDRVIPVEHAKALAAGVPTSRLTLIAGGHNDWSGSDAVRIRNP